MRLLCHVGSERIWWRNLTPAELSKLSGARLFLFPILIVFSGLCIGLCLALASLPVQPSAAQHPSPRISATEQLAGRLPYESGSTADISTANTSKDNIKIANDPEPAGLEVAVGLGGMWKIGHVTPIRIELPAGLASRAASIDVSTFDGDGVAVTYHRELSSGATEGASASAEPAASDEASADKTGMTQTFWSSVTIGRGDRPLKVRVFDAAGATLAERQLRGGEIGQALPPTQTWIVALGSSLGVEATSHTIASTGLPSFSTTVVSDPLAVPENWRGLAGCDVLIVSTTGSTPLVSKLNDSQWRAIGDWISHGGSAIISLGDYATRLPAGAPLRDLLPGVIVERLTGISTSPLEASTTTSVQLAPIVATRLKDVRGATELSMFDKSGKRFSWWVRYSIGKGVVTYIGSDLDEPVLRNWKDRRLVWDKLLASYWSRSQKESSGSERNVSGTHYLGYDDLVGQLRATLDYFPTARISSFGEIALFLALILIVIGPLDYWISVRWLRRPEFSWYLLGTVLVLSSIGLIGLERASRPQQLLVNSVQVVDFLPEEGRVLIDAWSHVYSSRARTIDIALRPSQSSPDARVDWQGLPGKGLGGMESNLLSDQGMPGYIVDVSSRSGQVEAEGTEPAERRAAISSVGIPTSGTKCFFATWSQDFTPSGKNQLRELKGIDQIEGVLINPIAQDILQPVLMYHNWIYQLPSRLRAGEELSLTYDMVPKDLMRRLNRRQIVNNNDVITSWVPENRESIDRLLEIMMFYKASGGFDYTGLQHRFQPRTDISNSLALDHAVLFGKLAQPLGKLEIENVPEDQIQIASQSTWCRVLVPVARAEE